MTRTGFFLGSVDYCAPEQIQGTPVDGRADVYSLGCVVFHCLAGQPPYRRETEFAVLNAHINDPPPAVSTLRPDLPRGDRRRHRHGDGEAPRRSLSHGGRARRRIGRGARRQ